MLRVKQTKAMPTTVTHNTKSCDQIQCALSSVAKDTVHSGLSISRP